MSTDELFDTNYLLRRVESGDERAVDLLYRRYIERVETWTRGRVPSKARDLFDTQIVAHDVLARSLLQATGGEGTIRHSFRAYVRQALRNRLTDLGRARASVTVEIDESLADAGPTPLEQLLEREFESHVRQGIMRLPPDQRELLALRFEQELSYAQLAERLGLGSEDAARMRVQRALVKLGDELDPAD